MSEFYFKCPHCKANICAENDMIGEKAPCPGCGKIVVVAKPAPSQIKKSAQKSAVNPSELPPKSDKTNAAPQPAEACEQAPQKENAKPPSRRINFFMIGLLILLNIQFGIFLDILGHIEVNTCASNYAERQMLTSIFEIQSDLPAHTQKTGKIIGCSVEHYDREQYTFGLRKAISEKIEAGYEPVGKICNDGVNGAFYLFIKRSK